MKYTLASISTKENGIYRIDIRGQKSIQNRNKEKTLSLDSTSHVEIMLLIHYWKTLLKNNYAPKKIIKLIGNEHRKPLKNEVIKISANTQNEIVIFDGTQEILLPLDEEDNISHLLMLVMKSLAKKQPVNTKQLKRELQKKKWSDGISYRKLAI